MCHSPMCWGSELELGDLLLILEASRVANSVADIYSVTTRCLGGGGAHEISSGSLDFGRSTELAKMLILLLESCPGRSTDRIR